MRDAGTPASANMNEHSRLRQLHDPLMDGIASATRREVHVDWVTGGDADRLFAERYARRRILVLKRATVRMLQQIATDTEAMQDAAVGVDMFLSDTHSGGQSVCRVHFSSGNTAYLKPRPSHLHEPLRQLLDEFHRRGLLARVRIPKQFAHGDHAWSQAIVAEIPTGAGNDHADRAHAQLLALCWLLGSVDMHASNIIYSAGAVYVIDEETAVHPVFHDTNRRSPLLHSSYSLSPFRSGVLQIPGTQGNGYTPAHRNILLHEFQRSILSMQACLKSSGLQEMLTELGRHQSRIILRPTAFYHSLLHLAARKGARKKIGDLLARGQSQPESRTPWHRHERDSLLIGDIPIFWCGNLPRTVSDGRVQMSIDYALSSTDRIEAAMSTLRSRSATDRLINHVRTILELTGA